MPNAEAELVSELKAQPTLWDLVVNSGQAKGKGGVRHTSKTLKMKPAQCDFDLFMLPQTQAEFQ